MKEEVPGFFLLLRECISKRSLKTPGVFIEVGLSLFFSLDISTSGTTYKTHREAGLPG